jgi:GNAT superfamily N-acetyltransferase
MSPGGHAIQIRELGPFEIRPYSHFAAPTDLTYVASGPAVAIGVESGGRPAGLALAHFVQPTAVRVVALTVEQSLRGLGIGRQLYARLEAELVARGAVLADVLAGNPHQFLEKAGWQLGARIATVYTFSKRVGEAPWLQSTIDSPSYELFPWLSHGPEDRMNALRLMENDFVARKLSPFVDPTRVFGPSSKGIRHASQLVGWCVTHKMTTGFLQYSSVYVAPKHRRTVAPLIVMGESIREHLRRSEELPNGVQAVPPELPEIERFAAKRLAPWADSVERVHVWWKSIERV